MTKKLKVEIVTPDSKFFEGEADMVVVPGAFGSLGFLPGHIPLITSLGKGTVRLNDDKNMSFDIEGGYVQIKNDNILILAEHVNS